MKKVFRSMFIYTMPMFPRVARALHRTESSSNQEYTWLIGFAYELRFYLNLEFINSALLTCVRSQTTVVKGSIEPRLRDAIFIINDLTVR
jgi:hypothetical protein